MVWLRHHLLFICNVNLLRIIMPTTHRTRIKWMEAQKTYDHRSLNTPSNGYTNTSNRSSFAYSFHFKTHTAPRQILYMQKQRDIQEQQLQQQQQSETSSMQTSLLFLFIPLNRNEAIPHYTKVRSPSTWWWSDVQTWSLCLVILHLTQRAKLYRGVAMMGTAQLHV